MDQCISIVRRSVTQVNSLLRSGGNQAGSIAKSAASAVVSNLNAAQSGAYSAGRNIGAGLVNGLNSKQSAVRSAARRLANAAEAAIRAAAKIHSPSRVADRLGGYWGEGYANGIDGMTRRVWRASERLAEVPALAAGPSMDWRASISEDYDYTRDAQYTIVVPVQYDGREIARVTAVYTEAELERRETRERRKRGVR